MLLGVLALRRARGDPRNLNIHVFASSHFTAGLELGPPVPREIWLELTIPLAPHAIPFRAIPFVPRTIPLVPHANRPTCYVLLMRYPLCYFRMLPMRLLSRPYFGRQWVIAPLARYRKNTEDRPRPYRWGARMRETLCRSAIYHMKWGDIASVLPPPF